MTDSIFQKKGTQDLMLAVLAIILFVSPWLLDYANTRADWSAWVSAIILAFFVAVSFFEMSMRGIREWEEWVTAIIGLGIIAEPTFFGFATTPRVANTFWLIGLLTIVVSLWAEWTVRHPPTIAQH